MPENAGIVAVQLVSNASQLSAQIEQWDTLVVLSLPEGKVMTVPATGSGFVGTRAFVGALSPGHYAVVGLYATQSVGDTTYSMRAFIPPVVGSFDVQAKRLTDLGTLIYQPFDEASAATRSIDYLVSRIPDSGSMLELLRAQFPAQYATLESPAPLGWRDDAFADTRQQVSDQARRVAVATQVDAAGDDESFWLLGHLGQMVHRDASARWTRTGVDTPYQLTALAEFKDGSVLVGGERGTLYRRAAAQTSWERMDSPQVDASVIEIGQFANGNVYLLAEQADAFALLSSADGRQWAQVASFPKLRRGWLADAYNMGGISFPYSLPSDNHLDLWMDGKLIRYSAADGTVQSHPAPEFSRLMMQGNGILVGREYSSMNGEKAPRFSRDRGQTWQSVGSGESIFKTSMAVPYVFSDGSLLRSGGTLEFKLFGAGWTEKEQIPLLASKDAGVTWQAVGALPKRCDAISHEASTDTFLVTICRDGRVLGSRDRGLNWVQEYGAAPRKEDFPAAVRDTAAPATP